MAEHSIMVDIDDARTSEIAEVLANKTCKKILSLLAEKDLSEGDIANELRMPLNTVDYNVKKLVSAGLIEQARGWFWSVKGKKILTYKLSNKRIVISPMRKLRGIIPAVLATGAIALGIKIWGDYQYNAANVAGDAGEIAVKSVSVAGTGGAMPSESSAGFSSGIYYAINNAPDYWAWFLLGALTALVIFLLWNWRKK